MQARPCGDVISMTYITKS